VHVVPPFQVPYEYKRWEAMDFGVTNPTAWLASALSPQGHTLVYDEYYAPGLINEHASAVLTRRSFAWGEPVIAVCDPSIKARTGFGITGAGDTVHSEFQKNGLYLVPANNDRRAGRVRISQLLKPDPSLLYPDWHEKAGQLGSPRIFFTTQCINTIKQLKLAPIDAKEGDIVDPFWESRRGHAVAALRYLTTARIYPREQLQQFGQGGRILTRQWATFRDSEPYG